MVLKDIRVLDFGRYIAGPYCATLLGYLGADVIRIEKPGGGEDRFIAPVTESGEGGVFMQTACNKRSLTLNFKSPHAGQIIKRLVQSADVVVANLPPRALEKLGLDYATLRSYREDIVLASQTTFGHKGPYRDRGGFDGVGQAMSGAMYMTGTAGNPVKAAAPYVDFSTAVMAAFGVLAALMHRDQTGEGQEVQASLMGTALAAFNSHLVEQGVTGINRQPTGNRVQTSAPSDVFATRDGHILVHTVGDGLFRRLAKLLGADDWLANPEYVGDQNRGDHRDAICERMASWCAARSNHEALSELESAGLAAGPVYDLDQTLNDPQVAAMDWLHPVMFPGLAKPAPVAQLPLTFSTVDAGIKRRPPTLGEHTEAILQELDWSETQIAEFRSSGTV